MTEGNYVSPSPSIPISQPPGTWIFPEDGNFPTNKISEGSPDGSPNHHHRYRPAHATNFARSDHFVPFISNELVDEIREPTKIPSSPTSHSSATLHLLSNYYCGPEHTTFLSTPIEPRSPAIGFASGVPYLPSSYSIAEHREHGEPHLHRTDESDPEDLHSPSVCSASPRSDLHPTGAEADLTIHIEPHSIKLQKSYNCSTCHKSFARPSALRKHEKMHTTKQAFACDAVGCGKKFGVRSNLQRHQQVVHGIRRAHKWARDYKVEFEHPSLSPSLISDTASMPPSGLVWDNEGPFSRREINWPSSQTARAQELP
ncbi:hypothetical protein C8R45DRAFT_987018 [Mycena sanguinolenta]|nr:hypothetical protein C8R45DRAFT_987018 [Mycena sanguinolenta]